MTCPGWDLMTWLAVAAALTLMGGIVGGLLKERSDRDRVRREMRSRRSKGATASATGASTDSLRTDLWGRDLK